MDRLMGNGNINNFARFAFVMATAHQVDGGADEENSVVPIDASNGAAISRCKHAANHARIVETRALDAAEHDRQTARPPARRVGAVGNLRKPKG